ncbi:hypothetical protein [Streptomyces sp. NPDC007369]|uniref:hypothetical protein n=1 Tax=Streptomyces sp. NPDC007369 TaxID=3154589 RepID=UPI00340AD091
MAVEELHKVSAAGQRPDLVRVDLRKLGVAGEVDEQASTDEVADRGGSDPRPAARKRVPHGFVQPVGCPSRADWAAQCRTDLLGVHRLNDPS